MIITYKSCDDDAGINADNDIQKRSQSKSGKERKT